MSAIAGKTTRANGGSSGFVVIEWNESVGSIERHAVHSVFCLILSVSTIKVNVNCGKKELQKFYKKRECEVAATFSFHSELQKKCYLSFVLIHRLLP